MQPAAHTFQPPRSTPLGALNPFQTKFGSTPPTSASPPPFFPSRRLFAQLRQSSLSLLSQRDGADSSLPLTTSMSTLDGGDRRTRTRSSGAGSWSSLLLGRSSLRKVWRLASILLILLALSSWALGGKSSDIVGSSSHGSWTAVGNPSVGQGTALVGQVQDEHAVTPSSSTVRGVFDLADDSTPIWLDPQPGYGADPVRPSGEKYLAYLPHSGYVSR